MYFVTRNDLYEALCINMNEVNSIYVKLSPRNYDDGVNFEVKFRMNNRDEPLRVDMTADELYKFNQVYLGNDEEIEDIAENGQINS
mgnify:CR=1 FL=1